MEKMKKVVCMVMIVVFCLTAAGCSGKGSEAVEKYGSDTLKIFLPGEYMADNLVTDFEKQFGVKVIVELFNSNEMMYTKVAAGDTYDVLIPSDYMIERLLKEDMLQKIDLSLVPNLSVLAEDVRNMDYDPDNSYSVPYFWGTVGIVYNHNNVSLEDLEKEGYDIFRDSRYKGRIYMYDSERDGFMMAMKQLGYSCNDDDEAVVSAAYDWLVDISENMSPDYCTDEVIDYMMNGNKDLAVVYSGDAATILSENEDMSYFTPLCGTNVWVDAMVIPANAENPKLAHEFMNFVLSYDMAMDNTLAVGYASPNVQVLEEVTAEGGDFADNEAYLPVVRDNDEVYHDNEKLRKKLSELWIKVVAAK